MTARPRIQVKRLKIIDMDSYSGKLGGRKQQRGDLRDMVKEGGSEVGSVEGSIICSSKAQGGQYETGIWFFLTNFMHLALVWGTTALTSNTRSEKRPLLNSYRRFQSFCLFKGWKCSGLPGSTAHKGSPCVCSSRLPKDRIDMRELHN